MYLRRLRGSRDEDPEFRVVRGTQMEKFGDLKNKTGRGQRNFQGEEYKGMQGPHEERIRRMFLTISIGWTAET